jgi:uncharacterized glyoxalase superfamily protein PhnB
MSKLMSDGSVLPVVRYAHPEAAADWLCAAYGFSIHEVADRSQGGSAHIVLRLDENYVLVAPNDASVAADQAAQPAEAGNRPTQTCYLTVKDVDRHFAHARMAGARVEVEPRDDDDGGRFYMARDLEGHLWTFGSPMFRATRARTDRLLDGLHQSPAKSSRAAVYLAMLLGLTVGTSAVLYIGADTAPKKLASQNGVPTRPDAALEEAERARLLEAAAKRLADVETAANTLTEKLRKLELQVADAQRQKQSAEQKLSASEAEHQSRIKDSLSALDAALRAREVASRELDAERLRAQAIQSQLDDMSARLASPRTKGSTVDAEAQRLRATMEQLGKSLLGSTEEAESARRQLTAAELRARVAQLEADHDATRSRAERTADSPRTAPATRAGELPHRATPRAADIRHSPQRHDTQDKWISVVDTERAEKLRQAAEATQRAEAERQRVAAETAQKVEEEKQRQVAEAAQKAEAERQRVAAETARKAEEEKQRQVAEAAQKAEAERQRVAAETARKVEEEKQRQVAEAAQKAEAERQRLAAEAARKVEEEKQRQVAEAAQKAEAERQRVAAETARKAEEEKQRQVAEAAQKAEAERQRVAAETARKAEEEKQRQVAEAAQKAEAERQRVAAETARKVEEERQRQATEAAQRAEVERQRVAAEAAQKAEAEQQRLATAESARIIKEAAEAEARADQERRRRALGLTVSPEDGARYLARGRALLSTGDVASARLFLERASNAGLAEAALELAETYDPATVTPLPNVVGLARDREQARVWYLRAQALGAATAAERLNRIGTQ